MEKERDRNQRSTITCYNCGKIGHTKREYRQQRQNTTTCNYCKKVGHVGQRSEVIKKDILRKNNYKTRDSTITSKKERTIIINKQRNFIKMATVERDDNWIFQQFY